MENARLPASRGVVPWELEHRIDLCRFHLTVSSESLALARIDGDMNLEIDLDEQDWRACRDPSTEVAARAEILAAAIQHAASTRPAKFAQALSGFRSDTARGTIDEDGIGVTDDGIEFAGESISNGIVYLEFTESAYYGCRDADNSTDHWGTAVEFQIDGIRPILVLFTAAEEGERTTEDEF